MRRFSPESCSERVSGFVRFPDCSQAIADGMALPVTQGFGALLFRVDDFSDVFFSHLLGAAKRYWSNRFIHYSCRRLRRL
jgi:hypothetical protein